MKSLISLIVTLALISLSALNAEERTWTSPDGKKLKAELISFDLDVNQVIIKNAKGKQFTLLLNRLSAEDQIFLKNLSVTQKAAENEKAKLIAERSGKTFSEKTEAGNTYHVYYPKSYSSEKKPPMLILFSGIGDGKGIMRNFKPGADSLGWVIVGCDNMGNVMDLEKHKIIFDDLLPVIEKRVDHDPQLLYMGMAGFTTGFELAYRYSAEYDRPWKGIISCNGRLGGKSALKKAYKKKMAVAMIISHHSGTDSWTEMDTYILEKRRCRVEVFNSIIADSPYVIEKAMKWVHKNTRVEK